MKTRKYYMRAFGILLCGAILSSCVVGNQRQVNTDKVVKTFRSSDSIAFKDVPNYSGNPFAYINDNHSNFTRNEIKRASKTYKYFSDLDTLGRCGEAQASLGVDTIPKEGEERQSISSVSPSGWGYNKQYDFVDGGWLYNRSHLIGYQLSSENANEKNLITGTRSFNVDGMLPFENITANYLKANKGRVLYRVTPIYEGNNLVANGVQMEACSVVDNCKDLNFNVYVYNVEDGVSIDYETGENYALLNGEHSEYVEKNIKTKANKQNEKDFILNTRSMIIHVPNCASVEKTADYNKKEVYESLEDLKKKGYKPCQNCLKGE